MYVSLRYVSEKTGCTDLLTQFALSPVGNYCVLLNVLMYLTYSRLLNSSLAFVFFNVCIFVLILHKFFNCS